jgi:hypothetical protein
MEFQLNNCSASSPKRTLGLSMLRTGYPTKPSLALSIILMHFAAKTLQHQLPLSVGHVPKSVICNMHKMHIAFITNVPFSVSRNTLSECELLAETRHITL